MLDHGQRCSLGEICTFTNGNGFRPKDWAKDGLPIIRIQNLNGSQEFNYFDGEPRKNWIVEPGELLFAWAGVKGVSFGPTIWPGPRGVLNQHIYRVTPKAAVDLHWLHAALQLVTRRVEAKSHGFKSSLVHVHKSDITEQVVSVPPLPEQRRIAGILRTWDEAIDAASRLIDAKRRRLDVLRANLLTPAHRGEGWRMALLGDLTAEGKGRNKGGALGREQVMGVSNARGVVPMRDATIASDLTRYKLLPPQGFAYNPMRINVGSIAMSALDAPVLVSPDYVVFTCRPKALAPGYLDHFRRTRFWSHYVNAMGSGSVRVRIYYRDLADIEIPVPGLAEQKRILRVLDLAAQDLTASETHLDALKRQKRGLMQKLLTGDWRVPAEPAG